MARITVVPCVVQVSCRARTEYWCPRRIVIYLLHTTRPSPSRLSNKRHWFEVGELAIMRSRVLQNANEVIGV